MRPTSGDCDVLAGAGPVPGNVVGAQLQPTLEDSVIDGYRLGPLVVQPFDDPSLVTPWYLIGAAVSDAEGQHVGEAVWLAPHAWAAFAADAGITMEQWREAPHEYPEATHLTTANDLAARVSPWRAATRVPAHVREVEECARAAVR